MAESKFDVQFCGELAEGTDALTVRARLGDLFKLSPEVLDRLFSGRPIVVKGGLDLDTALRYRDAFGNAGAIARVMASPDADATDSNLSPNPSDSDVDSVAAVTPADTDTGTLSLVPGNDWTLEDCAPLIAPVPLPDISHLALIPMEPVPQRPMPYSEEVTEA